MNQINYDSIVNALTSANAKKEIIEETVAIYKKLNPLYRNKIDKELRRYTLLQFCNNQEIITLFSPFYKAKRGNAYSAAGIGHGEIMILLAVKNSKHKYGNIGDVLIGNKIIEIKEIDERGEFRLGDIGNVNNTAFANNMLLFYNTLTELKLPKFNQVNTCLTNWFIKKTYDIKTMAMKEICASMIDDWKHGFEELHHLTKKFTTEYTILKINDDKYVISINEANRLKNQSDTTNYIPVKILGKACDDNMVDIILHDIAKHKYVKNPSLFEKDFNNIKTLLAKHIDYLIVFEQQKVNKNNIVKCQCIESISFEKKLTTERITTNCFRLKV